jgi:hypothetical protein
MSIDGSRGIRSLGFRLEHDAMFDEEEDGEERESRGRDGTRYMIDGRERARDAEAGVCAADMHHRMRVKEDTKERQSVQGDMQRRDHHDTCSAARIESRRRGTTTSTPSGDERSGSSLSHKIVIDEREGARRERNGTEAGAMGMPRSDDVVDES